ncbi:hypothetical protein B0H14DRAFT_2618578 [Mycena olivaceomarginata]|nr:hypothetical protein B0H14DRAFT_2618578 [Mycena olivaceomarginata]
MHSKGKSEVLVMDMLRTRIQSRKSSALRSHEMGPSCDVFVQIELEQRMGRGYMAALGEQITSLESENLGPKDCVVMGEAGAWSWPQAKVKVELSMPLLWKR